MPAKPGSLFDSEDDQGFHNLGAADTHFLYPDRDGPRPRSNYWVVGKRECARTRVVGANRPTCSLSGLSATPFAAERPGAAGRRRADRG
jgi:hypothetical protein